MEPDILASPSGTTAGSSWTPAGISPMSTAPPELDSGPALALPGAPPAGAVTNGHVANGHGHGAPHAHATNGTNGHRNGYGTRPRSLAIVGPMAEMIAALDARETGSLYQRFGKRALDVLGAGAALVLSLPVLLLAALLIKLESRGPVFYRSTRIGRNGRPFMFIKLRSMVQHADRHRHSLTHLNECDGPVFKISRDPRVTRVGRFLRVTSIDEIPQFMNVLRGDMSLVGPRPPIPEEVAQYEPWQLRRLDVRPGITCLWQISGRSRIGFQEWMRLDLEYIKRESLGLDVQILLRTIPAVISREGAY